jgi:hypothetical protein
MLHFRNCCGPAIQPFAELADQFSAMDISADCRQATQPELSIYTSSIVNGMDTASYQEWFGTSNLAFGPSSSELCASEQFRFNTVSY